MSYLSKIKTFISFTKEEKYLLIKAFCIVIIVEINLHFRPFDQIKSWLKNSQKNKLNQRVIKKTELYQIIYIIKIISKYLPFIKCYNKALTARILLNQKGYHSTLFIGFRRDDKQQLKGHASLESNGLIITGGNIHKEHIVTSVF